MSEFLTNRQTSILKFIKLFSFDKGYPPTRQEIADHFGFKSANAAQCHIEALVKKRKIELRRFTARGIWVV